MEVHIRFLAVCGINIVDVHLHVYFYKELTAIRINLDFQNTIFSISAVFYHKLSCAEFFSYFLSLGLYEILVILTYAIK